MPVALVPATPAAPTVKFDISEKYQAEILALLVRDDNFTRRCSGLIKPDYFDEEAVAILVSIALDYFEAYGTVAGTQTVFVELLKKKLVTGAIRDEVKPAVYLAVRAVFKADISSREFALDEVTKFAKHQALQEAMVKAINSMDKGEFDQIELVMAKALAVGANSDFTDYDFFEESRKREQHREDLASGKIAKSGVTTGLKVLDTLLYHGGWGRKEVSALMGGAKKGKSMGLGYFAAKAAVNGKNVIYVTLEVSTSIIADRTDACLSSTDMSALVASSGDVANKIQVIADDKKTKKTGELRLVNFSASTLTPKQLDRIIQSYKTKGIVFDLVVVDYADIMAPDDRTDSAIENSKQVWLGLRGIADRENLALLTATQTNREGFKEMTAKAEHAAEDFNKVRIADLIISINRTDEETRAGEARLFVAANRNGAGEFTIHIKQDMSKMQFITNVISVS